MTATPNFEDLERLAKRRLDAFSAVSTTLSKGLREIAAESTEYSKSAFAAGSQALEKLLGARSFESPVQIQSDYAKQAYEAFVTETARFSELYAKVASDALRPVASADANLSAK